MQAGQHMLESLNRHARVDGGYASVRSVGNMEKEDHMHSFFLAETCKYLFLLANDSFWKVCALQPLCYYKLSVMQTAMLLLQRVKQGHESGTSIISHKLIAYCMPLHIILNM